MVTDNYNDFWTGATDTASESHWVWEDGTAVSSSRLLWGPDVSGGGGGGWWWLRLGVVYG